MDVTGRGFALAGSLEELKAKRMPVVHVTRLLVQRRRPSAAARHHRR